VRGSNAGGGAGGSIYLAMNELIGSGNITAKGGYANTTKGGGNGAGGRVKLYFFSYFNSSTYPSSYN
jgi:hypothetical protein